MKDPKSLRRSAAPNGKRRSHQLEDDRRSSLEETIHKPPLPHFRGRTKKDAVALLLTGVGKHESQPTDPDRTGRTPYFTQINLILILSSLLPGGKKFSPTFHQDPSIS